MNIQPSSVMDATAGLVDGVKKKDFPLKFCTVCASNQNRFVLLPSSFSVVFFLFFFSLYPPVIAFALVGSRVVVSSLCRLVEKTFFFYRVMRGKDEARIDGRSGLLQKSSHDDISSRNYHRVMMFLHMISQSARLLCRARYKIDSSAMARKRQLSLQHYHSSVGGQYKQAGRSAQLRNPCARSPIYQNAYNESKLLCPL